MAFEREDANEGFSPMLSAEDEERERARESQIERAIARGFEALDFDRRIKEAIERREEGLKNVGTSGGNGRGLRMVVIPSRGALE